MKRENQTIFSFFLTVTELALNTGLMECGFTFGNSFQEFFKQQTGEENFKFNVDMVAMAKAIKESGDESFTLGDLLDIYYGKKYSSVKQLICEIEKYIVYYLINDFAANVNQRTDMYGGSVENKARFGSEIISMIREACGEDFIISSRISGCDPSAEEAIEIAEYNF